MLDDKAPAAFAKVEVAYPFLLELYEDYVHQLQSAQQALALYEDKELSNRMSMRHLLYD